MRQELFSEQLEHAFHNVASRHGQQYIDGGAKAWGITGASYLGFALCGLPSADLRRVQFHAREQFGPVILDCKWYDELIAECLNGQTSVDTLLPGPENTLCLCSVTDGLFLEMLDFCREG